MSNPDIVFMPVPKELEFRKGTLKLPRAGYILLKGAAWELMPAAERLKTAAGRDWHITADATVDTSTIVTLVCDPKLDTGDQGYRLDVSDAGLFIHATSPAGVFYGACTLCQLLQQCPKELPHLAIKDSPDFATRGVMIDVSRDKVPTLETLMAFTDMLAGWKINHVELYTEHTFEYRKHPIVWKNASPITGEDILRYDKFCQERFIELVPNQNTFGHMTRWLEHEEYRDLAEAPYGCDTVWGHRPFPFTLRPSDPRSLALVRDLCDELLPHFSSKLFNVGMDETVDLGRGRSEEECKKKGVGRVYLDYLLKVYKEVKKRKHTMLFWGDIMIHHPELIPELPKDVIALDWGYEANDPFAEHGEKFKAAGIPFWVCPGTSTWLTIAGRTENCLRNLANAAENGLAQGAVGYLNTDWGDQGHWQYLPVSYLGFLAGAGANWNAGSNGIGSIATALDVLVFQDKAGLMGQIAYDLGNVYLQIEKKIHNSHAIFQALAKPLDTTAMIDETKPEEFKKAEAIIVRALEDLKKTKMTTPDAALIKAEYTNAAKMLLLGCKLAQVRYDIKDGKDVSAAKSAVKKELKKVIAEHERLWLSRNRVGGLADSRKRLEDVLAGL